MQVFIEKMVEILVFFGILLLSMLLAERGAQKIVGVWRGKLGIKGLIGRNENCIGAFIFIIVLMVGTALVSFLGVT